MPIRFDLDPRSGFVRSALSGPVSAADISDHCRALRKANAHSRPAFIDVRQMDGDFSMGDLLAIAASAAREFAGEEVQPCAIVVGERRQFEWARILACLVAGWVSVGAFTDPREAEAWLRHGTETTAVAVARARLA